MTHPRQHARQAGFTLIELIIVIVVIGILSAVAIPKYQDLTASASKGVLQAVASAAASVSATNYALQQGGLAHPSLLDCSAFSALIDMPSNVTITASAITAGPGKSCTFNYNGTVNSFTATNIYGVT